MKKIDGVMFNAYPDSCGETLSDIVDLLSRGPLKGSFSLFYILPSIFQSDLDRGFSILAYDLDDALAKREDLVALKDLGIHLLLDFVLNHLSVQSPQFKDLIAKGDESEYQDFFIDWNTFWAGKGEVNDEGYIVPREEYLSKLFMRKPGLPVLQVPFPDGSNRFYWNTFYQKVTNDENGISFLGQMDLNGESERVWAFYDETLSKLKSYGGSIIRLDAFAYLHKKVGSSNFFNEPGTWNYLDRFKEMADRHDVRLLPEIHAKYADGIHKALAERGYAIYDFFFPGLVFYTIETGKTAQLRKWIDEILEEGYQTVNMLGCHDGIPVLDVTGLLNDEEIELMVTLMQSRGARIKDLYGPDGKKIAYYQVNTTFLSAFGEDETKLLLARAIQLFMPGTQLVWYLDLFAGTNDLEAADSFGHKEINRTNLSPSEISSRLELPMVQEQLKLVKFRNNFSAFRGEAELTVNTEPGMIELVWSNGNTAARLEANLRSFSYTIEYFEDGGEWTTL